MLNWVCLKSDYLHYTEKFCQCFTLSFLGSWHDSWGNPWGHAVTKASFAQGVKANVQLKSNIPIGAKVEISPQGLYTYLGWK